MKKNLENRIWQKESGVKKVAHFLQNRETEYLWDPLHFFFSLKYIILIAGYNRK